MAKKPDLAHVELLITRNKTRLKRVMTALDKLEKQKKRLLKAGQPNAADRLVQEIARPRAHVALADMAGTMGAAIREAAEDAGMVPASTLVAAVKGHIARSTEPLGPTGLTGPICPVGEPGDPGIAAGCCTTADSLGPTGPSGPQCIGAVGVPGPVKADANLEIPDFLRRQSSPEAEQIKAEQAETKRKKALGRVAKLKAKKSGETRKMPVSGKAALDLIRNG